MVSIYRNLQTGKRYRRGIAARLSKLRLARMLGIQGIDEATYLHTQPIVSIREQMDRCAACSSTAKCDQLLDEGVGDQAEFCENDATLKQVRQELDLAS
jgi:hypothetical protein